jgi:hypothetical protein
VEFLNPAASIRNNPLACKLYYLTGFRLADRSVLDWLERSIAGRQFDLAWVDTTHCISLQSIHLLRRHCKQVLGYMIDDPTGKRDAPLWATCRRAIPAYDLCVAVRVESEREFRHLGAQRVLRIWRGYDEVAHRPFTRGDEIPAHFRSDVAFIGTWMKEQCAESRDSFLLKLTDEGIPLSIWGNRWHKAPAWPKLRQYWRGKGLAGRDLVAAMQGAKVCLGLVSHGNRDLHTQRSAEIPFSGGLLCAERTSEHLQMYNEGFEAVFWSSPRECAEACRALLNDDTKRCGIRDAGMQRVRGLGLGNEPICRRILTELGFPEYGHSSAHLFRLGSVAPHDAVNGSLLPHVNLSS